MTNWVTNASNALANHPTQKQNSKTVESETRGSQDGLQANPNFTSTEMPPALENNLQQFFSTTARREPRFLTRILSKVATKFSRFKSTPLLVIFPKLIISNQPSLKDAQLTVRPHATQPQKLPTNQDHLPFMTQQIFILQPTSSFTVPAYHIWPNSVSMEISSNNKTFSAKS